MKVNKYRDKLLLNYLALISSVVVVITSIILGTKDMLYIIALILFSITTSLMLFNFATKLIMKKKIKRIINRLTKLPLEPIKMYENSIKAILNNEIEISRLIKFDYTCYRTACNLHITSVVRGSRVISNILGEIEHNVNFTIDLKNGLIK